MRSLHIELDYRVVHIENSYVIKLGGRRLYKPYAAEPEGALVLRRIAGWVKGNAVVPDTEDEFAVGLGKVYINIAAFHAGALIAVTHDIDRDLLGGKTDDVGDFTIQPRLRQ